MKEAGSGGGRVVGRAWECMYVEGVEGEKEGRREVTE